ncbi:DinB family protein [Paenibacillus taihuensis]|uniref:DinB family protein n=1 Tax=Paenibacillus taihuensis TaxID=1156355 RepID=A0A3D9RRQ5_9BACL|nr:DinB family protein [Paenibacillus taihuensis]REE80194.1 DinB family protein [Paenibacillus taihuensis]
MEQIFLKQLAFARGSTLRVAEGIVEDAALQIPAGFRNHILWHLGHIYTVHERATMRSAGLSLELPPHFPELFANGTSPLNWTDQPIPSLTELIAMLREQPARIHAALEGRFQEQALAPLTTPSGFTMETVGEFVGFAYYHEGLHTSRISLYKALLKL